MISGRKDVYVIVHPNNVSMPWLGKVTPSMGALPLPDTLAATRHFLDAVHTRLQEGNAICIYPEAHIWPYYTGIRPFTDKSFTYPVRENLPVFCFTNTYHRRTKSGRIRTVTYVDGPFYPNVSLSQAERRKDLRDRVYRTMCERAKQSTYAPIEYRQKEKQTND